MIPESEKQALAEVRALVSAGDVKKLRAVLSRRCFTPLGLSLLENALACGIKKQPSKAVALLELVAKLDISIADSFYATNRPFHMILKAVSAGVIPSRDRILDAIETWNFRDSNAFVKALWAHHRKYIIHQSIEHLILYGDATLAKKFFPACTPKILVRELLAALKPCVQRDLDELERRYKEYQRGNGYFTNDCRADISILYRKIAVLAEICYGVNSLEIMRITSCVNKQLTAFFVAHEMMNG